MLIYFDDAALSRNAIYTATITLRLLLWLYLLFHYFIIDNIG